MDNNRKNTLPMQEVCGESFTIRAYTKKELALMYFPDSHPHTAVNHLMAWIKQCPELWKEFEKMGYNLNSKSFTPRQVRLIFEYLGEP